jgi:hypothetical protein
MTRRRAALVLVPLAATCAASAASLLPLGDADAQRVDPRRASTFVVGPPGGPAPMHRVDARRSGAAREALPGGPLSLAWRKSVGTSTDSPALALTGGTLAVVTTRGDVVFIDEDGQEQSRVTVGAGSVGPAAVTSNGTVVFATSTGDAIGVTQASPRPRFVTRIGGERNLRAAPIATDDGGVVLATATDLVVLDSEGNVRSRVTLPEAPGAPLVASGARVLSISVLGTVYAWTPGREVHRVGSFGAPVDGGAALAAPSTLVGVIEGNHVVALDLARGDRQTRAVAPQGLYLGPPALRPGGSIALLGLVPTRGFLAVLDASGKETFRAPISTFTSPPLPDGGPPPLVAPPHVGPLVDARGAIAFAAPGGQVGVVAPDGAVDTLGELVCSKSGRSAGIAGLTPAGPGAFVVTCEGGAVAKVIGGEARGLRSRPSSPAFVDAGPAGPVDASAE